MNSFSGDNINRLGHFITPILEEDQPDMVIIPVGPNDITNNTINNIDAKGISKRVTEIRKKWLLYGVKEVIITSISIKRHFNLLGSSGKSMITYAMNAVVTNFISLVTTTSPTNIYEKMDYT